MHEDDPEGWGPAVPGADDLDREVLADTPEGRQIASSFVATFGAYVEDQVRPVLRDVAASGGEPQLLVNGLARLLREVADAIEMPPDTSRSGPAARR